MSQEEHARAGRQPGGRCGPMPMDGCPMTGCVHGPDGHDGTVPLYGTAAARAKAWLLIEHPGPWPAYFGEMKMPPALDSVLHGAEERDIRPQLIRRPQGRRVAPPLQAYAAWTVGSEVWIEGRELASHADLLHLDLDALAAGRSPNLGPRTHGTVWLVCTHGRRSACCARLGRPLAVSLSEQRPAETWETTHVGGDDFAANLVCLPHGLYYGQVTPANADTVVAAYERGEVVLENYRGRAGLAGPLQAAEYFVRDETGHRRIGDLSVESSATGSAVTEALVRANGSRYRVVIEEAPPGSQLPPCAAAGAVDRSRYRLLDLAPATSTLG